MYTNKTQSQRSVGSNDSGLSKWTDRLMNKRRDDATDCFTIPANTVVGKQS